jgi:hypothetical protein
VDASLYGEAGDNQQAYGRGITHHAPPAPVRVGDRKGGGDMFLLPTKGRKGGGVAGCERHPAKRKGRCAQKNTKQPELV